MKFRPKQNERAAYGSHLPIVHVSYVPTMARMPRVAGRLRMGLGKVERSGYVRTILNLRFMLG